MKAFTFCFLLSALAVHAQLDRSIIVAARSQARSFTNNAPPPAGGSVSFTDDFNRTPDANELGPNWTKINGDMNIIGNALHNISVSTEDAAVYNTALGTVNQYVKFTMTDVNSFRSCKAILRYTDASSPFYLIEFDAQFSTLEWSRIATATFGTVDSIQSVTTTITSGDSVGVVISGTGTGTVVAFWLNPTGAAPTSATVWGGAGPTQSFSNDPANAVNTGSKVGVSMKTGSDNGQKIDDFSGGDVP